jgi:hypothetical protein
MTKTYQQSESGQGLVEYALLIILVGVMSILALRLLGVNVAEALSRLDIGMDSTTIEPEEEENDYRTDFDEGISEWESINWKRSSSRNWHTDTSKVVAEKYSGIFLTGYESDDFSFYIRDIDLSTTSSAWNGFSVFFRATNTTRISGYSFRVQKPNKKDVGRIYFSKWANGYQITPVIQVIDADSSFDWEGIHDLRIVANGSQLTAYLDGQLVLQTTDSTYTSGSVGLYTHRGSTLTADYLEVISSKGN